MIQFRRGSSSSWRRNTTPLADGQPGYDKETHKLKIGDGKSSWDELPDASGLRADEILDSEENAKKKVKAVRSMGLLGSLLAKLVGAARPIITYGTEAPTEDTVGQVYLQYYDTEPETDYIVSSGVNGIWTYQKWHSGIARCCGILDLTTSVQNAFENADLFYDNKTMKQINYPFTFKTIPSEVATLQSPGGISWLASRGKNSKTNSAMYSIISPDKQSSATYTISLQVEGTWK